MTASSETPASNLFRRARRYRQGSLAILLLGVAGAGLIYGLGMRAANLDDDPSMAGFNRASERQMGVLYGKQGRLVEDLTAALKRPGTQAVLVIVAACAIAGVGFHCARIFDEEAQEETGLPSDREKDERGV